MKKYILKSPKNKVSQLPSDYLKELNVSQKEAVLAGAGPLLVIAGAGSGKTKALVYRVARLIDQGVAPNQILLLTFTRKASQEMLKRAAALLDHRCHQVEGGTFHGFAHSVLRQYAHHLGYDDNFTIIDRPDAEDLVNLLRRELGHHKSGKRFPKKNTITSIISKSINTEQAVQTILAENYPQFVDYTDAIVEIRDLYQKRKKEMQVLDYDDLLIKLVELFETAPEVRETLQKKFKYILVDEYQDTNAIQADIILHLAGTNGNVMVVGDDAQSIYSFRGANFKNILLFPDFFPNAKVIRLEQNYRSTQPILDMTNALIHFAKEKFTKNLFTDKKEGRVPVYVETESENMQSRFVCQKILELREEGIPLDKIAVLIRSGWHSNDLEVELKSHNIPFSKVGGFKFIETAHVKDVISYLRIIYNPADIISWIRVLQLIEGVGPKTANDLALLFSVKEGSDLQTRLEKYRKNKFYLDLAALIGLLYHPKRMEQKPTEILNDVIEFYQPFFKLKYDDFTKRATDLDSVQTISERYDELENFLSEMSLEPPESSQVDALHKESDETKMTISTIHSAKGLEWHSVFIISAIDGYLPSFQSLNDMAQLEEERRLLYVAMTRAEENLFVIKPHLQSQSGQYYRHPGLQFSKLSRFLREGDIIDTYAEKWNLVEEHKTYDPDHAQTSSYQDPFEGSDRRKYYF